MSKGIWRFIIRTHMSPWKSCQFKILCIHITIYVLWHWQLILYHWWNMYPFDKWWYICKHHVGACGPFRYVSYKRIDAFGLFNLGNDQQCTRAKYMEFFFFLLKKNIEINFCKKYVSFIEKTILKYRFCFRILVKEQLVEIFVFVSSLSKLFLGITFLGK